VGAATDYDDTGCMLTAVSTSDAAIVVPYVNSPDGDWVDARQARFIYSPTLRTLMAFGVAFFGSPGEAAAAGFDGTSMDREGLMARFRRGDMERAW
jgi:hypothetical protein